MAPLWLNRHRGSLERVYRPNDRRRHAICIARLHARSDRATMSLSWLCEAAVGPALKPGLARARGDGTVPPCVFR